MRGRWVRLGLWCCLTVAAGVAAVSLLRNAPGAGAIDCEGCNVVLVLADTLRADRLASYGYPRVTSPFLDRLAGEAIQFRRARSQAACTFPSVNSLLTSRGAAWFLDAATQPGIPPHIPSLATVLRQRGYATSAVSASPIVRRSPSHHNPRGGFGQGFDEFDESVLWHDAGRVTQAASRQLRRLRRLGRPFLLYVHYMDPHDPYQPDAELRGTFAGPYRGEHGFIATGDATPIETKLLDGEPAGVSRADLEHLSDLYDEEILTLDRGIERLFAELAALELLQSTVVVVAADHGESFLEHETVKHCHSLYESDTWVPLLLRLPGRRTAQVVDELVENLDIVPTLLDLLRLDSGSLGLEGRSARPAIERQEPIHRFSFSASAALRSVNDRRYKLIFSPLAGETRLYDLDTDPAELDDRSGGERGELRRLRQALDEWMEAQGAAAPTDEQLRRAREIEQGLRALGYLG